MLFLHTIASWGYWFFTKTEESYSIFGILFNTFSENFTIGGEVRRGT
jgi:hypothetical protein